MNNKVSSRGITIAKTWKKNKIQELVNICNEMKDNNVDSKLIEDFYNSEKKKVNDEYEKKINKYQDKILEKQKKIDIDNVIKTKNILEKNGYTKKQIDDYINKEMNYINNKYNNVNFID
jgi:hypothetical protein